MFWGESRHSGVISMDVQQFQAFKNLDRTQIQTFVGVCQKVIVPPGGPMVKQSSHGKRIFFVLEGEVRVCLDTPSGEKDLARLNAPTVLGEIGFFSGEPSSANVIAVTQVRALLMPYDDLRQRLHEGDSASAVVVLNMAEAIAQRAAAMTRRISELYSNQPDEQLSELQSASKGLFGEWSFL